MSDDENNNVVPLFEPEPDLNAFEAKHPRESLISLLRRAHMQAERCNEHIAAYFIAQALDELSVEEKD
jgi:hypothetical protein